MFIEMAEQLEQARFDLLRKAAQISMIDDDQMMTAAINTVFNTLNGQIKSLEKKILANVMKNLQFTADCAAPRQENWEDESRKHLARMNQNLDCMRGGGKMANHLKFCSCRQCRAALGPPDMLEQCFGPHAPGMQ